MCLMRGPWALPQPLTPKHSLRQAHPKRTPSAHRPLASSHLPLQDSPLELTVAVGRLPASRGCGARPGRTLHREAGRRPEATGGATGESVMLTGLGEGGEGGEVEVLSAHAPLWALSSTLPHMRDTDVTGWCTAEGAGCGEGVGEHHSLSHTAAEHGHGTRAGSSVAPEGRRVRGPAPGARDREREKHREKVR